MATAATATPASREAPRESWVVLGTYPSPLEDVAGVPALLRLAGEAAMAGATRVFAIWRSAEPPPDITAIAQDPRLASRAKLELVTAVPAGSGDDPILVLRGDRVFHRDLPKQSVTAWKSSHAPLAKVAGREHDAVWVSSRETATAVLAHASEPRGISAELDRREAAGEIAEAGVPYLGFTTPVSDPRTLRKAEHQLVWSLRKSADGIAAKLINRHISLPITWLLRRVPILPNHVTAVALLCAVAGAFVLAQGGHLAAAIGMLLVNLGSIVDGIDGELARLRFQFSRSGQWFDTVADDLANIAYSTGVMINLDKAGVTWAQPLWLTALICFVLTQSTQYFLIRVVYQSGDLAAIPWAFQSSEFLSQTPKGLVPRIKATLPKLLKRDFAVTFFTVCGLFNMLSIVIVVYSTGAIVFFCVFFTQFVRNFSSLPRRT